MTNDYKMIMWINELKNMKIKTQHTQFAREDLRILQFNGNDNLPHTV